MEKYRVEIIDEQGIVHWYKFGTNEFHRLNGPAIEYPDGVEWYQNGLLHREDGPAVEWSDGTKEWWIEGELLKEEEFNSRIREKNQMKYINDLRSIQFKNKMGALYYVSCFYGEAIYNIKLIRTDKESRRLNHKIGTYAGEIFRLREFFYDHFDFWFCGVRST